MREERKCSGDGFKEGGEGSGHFVGERKSKESEASRHLGEERGLKEEQHCICSSGMRAGEKWTWGVSGYDCRCSREPKVSAGAGGNDGATEGQAVFGEQMDGESVA